MADVRLPSIICNEVYFLKNKLQTSKIIFPILLLIIAFILIGFRTIIAKKNASTWYAPLTDITYHSDGSSSSGDNVTFLLHNDSNFELSYLWCRAVLQPVLPLLPEIQPAVRLRPQWPDLLQQTRPGHHLAA